jgi:DNA-binding PadR family transcriptional regulator
MRTQSPAGFDLWEAVDGIRDAFAPMAAKAGARMGRGDIRTAILAALATEPMHGYQIIQAIGARTGGMWKPSPGSIYPTLQLLADEGLVTSEQVGERKVYTLTDEGKAAAADMPGDANPWSKNMRENTERSMKLPKAGAKLAQAAMQVQTSGSPEQSERAVAIIDEARRKLYAILAEE